jgi:hypothetical protein
MSTRDQQKVKYWPTAKAYAVTLTAVTVEDRIERAIERAIDKALPHLRKGRIDAALRILARAAKSIEKSVAS